MQLYIPKVTSYTIKYNGRIKTSKRGKSYINKREGGGDPPSETRILDSLEKDSYGPKEVSEAQSVEKASEKLLVIHTYRN